MSLFLLLSLGTIWGSGYSLAKYATTHGVSPLGYSFWQCFGPAIILLCFNFFESRKIKFLLSSNHLIFFLVSGVLGLALPNFIMYNVASMLPSGVLSIVVNIVPVITFILTVALGINRFNWSMLSAVLLVLLGLGLLFGPVVIIAHQLSWKYLLLALIVPTCFASYSIFVQLKRPLNMCATTMALGMLCSATLIQVPFILYYNQFYVFNFPFSFADWAIVFEVALSSLGYIILFKLIHLAGANYYSFVPAVVVIVSIVLGKVLFNEVLSYYVIAAMFCIVASIMLATKNLKKTYNY